MWKVLLGILVAGFVLHRLATGWSQPAAPHAAATPVAAAVNGYLEARVLMRSQQQEAEIVVVSDSPTSAQCAHGAEAMRSVLQCAESKESDMTCEVKSFVCRPDVDLRYLRMLDKQPAALHYAHLQYGADDAAQRRRAVIVGWGFTVELSQVFCDSLAERWRQKGSGVVTCI